MSYAATPVTEAITDHNAASGDMAAEGSDADRWRRAPASGTFMTIPRTSKKMYI